MVRVKCPPGGETKLEAEVPEIKAVTVRVLKPPGGGSSIMFGEDDDFAKSSSKTSSPGPNATPAPDASKENVPSTTETSTPESDPTSTPQKPTLTNGMNGDVKTDSSSSTTPSCNNSSSPHTPSSLKDPDTKTRLFGDDTTNLPPRENTPRRVKDHMKSSIFAADETTSPRGVANGTASPALTRMWGGGGGRRRPPPTVRNPITGEGVFYWDLHPPRSLHVRRKGNPASGTASKQNSTESNSANDKPLETPQPRGRIPPGGFSTKLW